MKKLLLALVLLIGAICTLQAQRTVTGAITSKDGEPLIGASILVKGTSSGTVSDFDGTYNITIPDGGTHLVISYTGFSTEEVEIGNSSVIDVSLSEGVLLSEAVVTALGIERSEKSVPYAVQTIQAAELNVIRQTNLNNALAGKVSGIQVRGQSSMALDRNSSIRIRGAGSLTDKEPLYVVDGTPVNSLDINMDDVESLTVLKGPSATAIYGQRGDAGVIVIKTKRGIKRPGIGLEFNQSTVFDQVYVLPEYQNSYAGGASADLIQFNWQTGMPEEWKALEGKYYHDYSDDASWGPRMVGQEYIPWYSWYVGTPVFGETAQLLPQPDNIRNFYENGVTLNNNLNFSQANEGYSVRISLGNQSIKGMIPNSSLDKYTISSQSSIDLGKHFTANANINFISTHRTGDFDDGYANQSSGSFNQWFHRNLDLDKIRELQGMKSPEGILASWNHNNPGAYLSSPLNFYGGNYWYNFYDYFENYNKPYNRGRLYGDLGLTYKLDDHFSIGGFLRRSEVNVNEERTLNTILETSATQTGVRASYYTGQDFFREDNYEALATYNNRFGKLSVEANAGGNIRKETRSYLNASTVDGLNVPDLFTLANSKTSPFSYSNFRSKKEVRSLYARGSFGFNDFIYADWSVRNDWSSALPKNANSYLYPSVGMSFVFSELFSTTSSFLSYGKIRGSWAQVGSDLDAYQLALNYSVGTNQWNGNFLMGTPNELIDPNIKPSLSSAYELGFDLRFFTNKLALSATYYNESKVDEILSVPIADVSGFTSKKINAGQIDRHGVELQLQATPVRTSDLRWDMTLNFAKNTTEIIELADGIDAYIQETGTFGTTSGARLVHQVGQTWGQVRGGGFKMLNGQRVVDASGLYVAEPDTYFGSALPDFTGGFVNVLAYKDFQLFFNIDFSKGGKYFSLSDHWGTFSGLFARTAELNDKGNPSRDPVADGGGVHVVGVTEDGTPVDTYVDAQTYWHNFRNRRIAEESVYDLDFIKLREVSLGYNIPVKKIGIGNVVQGATVSLVARNPWLIYAKNRDFDPSEIASRYGENGQFPGTRSIGFNLSFKF